MTNQQGRGFETDIDNLPDEFDFKSTINPIAFNIIYHAKRNGEDYEITWLNIHHTTMPVSELRQHLLDGNYVIIAEEE